MQEKKVPAKMNKSKRKKSRRKIAEKLDYADLSSSEQSLLDRWSDELLAKFSFYFKHVFKSKTDPSRYKTFSKIQKQLAAIIEEYAAKRIVRDEHQHDFVYPKFKACLAELISLRSIVFLNLAILKLNPGTLDYGSLLLKRAIELAASIDDWDTLCKCYYQKSLIALDEVKKLTINSGDLDSAKQPLEDDLQIHIKVIGLLKQTSDAITNLDAKECEDNREDIDQMKTTFIKVSNDLKNRVSVILDFVNQVEFKNLDLYRLNFIADLLAKYAKLRNQAIVYLGNISSHYHRLDVPFLDTTKFQAGFDAELIESEYVCRAIKTIFNIKKVVFSDTARKILTPILEQHKYRETLTALKLDVEELNHFQNNKKFKVKDKATWTSLLKYTNVVITDLKTYFQTLQSVIEDSSNGKHASIKPEQKHNIIQSRVLLSAQYDLLVEYKNLCDKTLSFAAYSKNRFKTVIRLPHHPKIKPFLIAVQVKLHTLDRSIANYCTQRLEYAESQDLSAVALTKFAQQSFYYLCLLPKTAGLCAVVDETVAYHKLAIDKIEAHLHELAQSKHASQTQQKFYLENRPKRHVFFMALHEAAANDVTQTNEKIATWEKKLSFMQQQLKYIHSKFPEHIATNNSFKRR